MNAVGAVIVTYRPDVDFSARLAAIACEVDRLLIIDNTADATTEARLLALANTHHAELVANKENVGLAAALNHGFGVLADEGYPWAIAFDQDSTPHPGFVAAFIKKVGHGTGVAVAGANWTDEGRPQVLAQHLRPHPRLGMLFERVLATTDLAHVTCVITSGSLFHLPTWRSLDGFDESLFLDLVDTDYCLRAHQAGHEVCVVAKARMQHRRGMKQAVRFLGRTWWPAFMPPLRLHYLFRNRMRLLRRHATTAPHWMTFEIVYTTKIFTEILLLEDDKVAKLYACLRGIWDGLRGRAGRLDEPVAVEKPSAAEPAA